jgi:hypothetical protein
MSNEKKPSWFDTLDMIGAILMQVISFNPDEQTTKQDY